ncbi:hypothetical protein [Pontiella desulfatans]|nr:hypothetical protein [Pontiella desulfatans]
MQKIERSADGVEANLSYQIFLRYFRADGGCGEYAGDGEGYV